MTDNKWRWLINFLRNQDEDPEAWQSWGSEVEESGQPAAHPGSSAGPAPGEPRPGDPAPGEPGGKFRRLARALNSNVSQAFQLYHQVENTGPVRITLDQLLDLVNGLPPAERTPERVVALVLAGEWTPLAPAAPEPRPPRSAARRRPDPPPPPEPPEPRIVWTEQAPPTRPAPSPTRPVPSPDQPPAPPPPPPKKEPPARAKKEPEARIDWGGPATGDGLPNLATLIGIEDAFEHTPLLPGEQVAFCKYDQVAYHLSTWNFLRVENGGRCCSCGRSGSVVMVTLPGALVAPTRPIQPAAQPAWMKAGQEIISLKDVPNYINRTVVVQDFVHEVYQSKSAGTFFVRFERRQPYKPPFDGFKVVIFSKYQETWRQAGIWPTDYVGKVIRVRGVIWDHPKWGIEILVHRPYMIQIVEEEKKGV